MRATPLTLLALLGGCPIPEPTVTVVSPVAHEVSETGIVDVTVEYDATAAASTVDRIELLADGRVVASQPLVPTSLAGTVSLQSVDLSAFLRKEALTTLSARLTWDEVSAAESAEVDVIIDAVTGTMRRLAERSETTAWTLVGSPGSLTVSARIAVEGADVHERALAFLEDYPALWGMTAPRREVILRRILADEGQTTVVFGQQIEGRVVEGGYILVVLDDTSVLGATGAWSAGSPLLEEPTIAVDRAVAAARGVLGADAHPVGWDQVMWDPSLVEPSSTEPIAVAWRVTMLQGARGSNEVFVDGSTGEVLALWSGERTAAPTSSDYVVSDALGAVEPAPGKCFDPGLMVCADEFGCDAGASLDAQLAVTRIEEMHDHLYDDFERLGVDGEGGSYDAVVRVDLGPEVYGKWVAGCGEIRLAVPPGRRLYGHETAHALVDHGSKLLYTGQTAALEEHIATIMGFHFDYAYSGATPPYPANPTSPTHLSQDSSALTASERGYILTEASRYWWDGDTWQGAQVGPLTDPGVQIGQLYYRGLLEVGSGTAFAGWRQFILARAALWAESGENGLVDADVCTLDAGFTAVGVGGTVLQCDAWPPPDTDGDGILDQHDNCPEAPNTNQHDLDGDGIGNMCDLDIDGDGVANNDDDCPLGVTWGETFFTGPDCSDGDGDGVVDADDNCPDDANPAQVNTDGDELGNVCDVDDDNDGIPDPFDHCPFDFDPIELDADGDGVFDACDNCAADANADQLDTDFDQVGDACDPDRDGDGIDNVGDNCPDDYNPGQEDNNGDGVGKACDLLEFLSVADDLLWLQLPEQIPEWSPIPVQPCATALCPPWTDGTTRFGLQVNSDLPVDLVLFDRRMHLITRSMREARRAATTVGWSVELEFDLDADHHYVDGAGRTLVDERYWLVLLPRDPSLPVNATVSLQAP